MTTSGRTIVVDMTEVTYCSLEGAAMLATLTRRCDNDGRILRIQPSPVVRHKLALSGLDAFIPLTNP